MKTVRKEENCPNISEIAGRKFNELGPEQPITMILLTINKIAYVKILDEE